MPCPLLHGVMDASSVPSPQVEEAVLHQSFVGCRRAPVVVGVLAVVVEEVVMTVVMMLGETSSQGLEADVVMTVAVTIAIEMMSTLSERV